MVHEVGAFEAKTHLSELLQRVREGDRVIITHRGAPVAVLVPPGELVRDHVAEVITKLRELRKRTKPGPGSIRKMRDQGRRR